jgi:hypothetical protein
MTETLPIHSPLGASSAERWMKCPGSVALIKSVGYAETEEPDYRREGTAAHEAVAHCLRQKLDAWEVIGEKFYGTEVDVEMADAIQVYLDTVRPLMVEGAVILIEHRISAPDHPLFYGTVDCATISDSLLTVSDFKYGQGVVVEVENNLQIMYYAYGILLQFPDVRRVALRIVQPRGFHPDGPVRRWVIDADYIIGWAQGTLLPAMEAVAVDNSLDVGDHCRFCTAKLVCPLLTSVFRAAATSVPGAAVSRTDANVALEYPLLKAAEMYIKAHKADILNRLMDGNLKDNGVCKLVNKKADRVWKPEAKTVFIDKYGDTAMTTPELKSPAQMEKIDGSSKKLVHEYAFTPQSGYTVADINDKRPAVLPQKSTTVFKDALDSVSAEE